MEEKITENEIVRESYNFILDSSITDDEWKAFIKFKNSLGVGTEFSSTLLDLSGDLRQIAVKNISKHVGLTPNVSEFYQKIVNYGQIKLNWARSLASYGMLF